jgi:hypothetical protein
MEQQTLTPETVTTETVTAETTTENLTQTPLTTEEQLNALVNRRAGEFDIKIGYADLKYIKNSLNTKIEWKGPNEAYLILISSLTIDNILSTLDPKSTTATLVKIPAATIESINYFLTKITGKGVEPAQRLFSIAMMFRQTVESLKKIDEEISFLQTELESAKK